VCIRCSKLIYRYCNETPCTLLAYPRRWKALVQGVHELSPSFPFALPSAVRTFCILRAPLTLFHLDPLKCTAQLVVCIRCSKLIYRYCNETPCTLLAYPRRWSWSSPCLGLPSPCPRRYYGPLTFILLQGTQLIEKIRECTLLPTVQVHSQTSPPRLCILLHSASQ
jgi:hypothetical protein